MCSSSPPPPRGMSSSSSSAVEKKSSDSSSHTTRRRRRYYGGSSSRNVMTLKFGTLVGLALKVGTLVGLALVTLLHRKFNASTSRWQQLDSEIITTTTKDHQHHHPSLRRVTVPHSIIDNDKERHHDDDNNKKIEPTQGQEPPRPCLIAVENRADYHYEVIESTILQYPLPWHTWKCNPNTAIFDVALAESHVWSKTEKEPWKRYFEQHLAGTVRNRADGVSQAHFGSLVQYSNYTKPYDAVIGVSCDSDNFQWWLRNGVGKHFCVLHTSRRTPLPPELEKQSCWLSPMHHPKCYFVPSSLPKFPKERPHHNNNGNNNNIRVCIKRGHRSKDDVILANALQQLQLTTKDVTIAIMGGREDNIPTAYREANLTHLMENVVEPDFYRYEYKMSQCDALIPLIHPWGKGIHYFPDGVVAADVNDNDNDSDSDSSSGSSNNGLLGGKLSGYISQAVGLEIPTVLHVDLYKVYEHHLTAASWTYTISTNKGSPNNNNTKTNDTFVDAFQAMLTAISSSSSSSSNNNDNNNVNAMDDDRQKKNKSVSHRP